MRTTVMEGSLADFDLASVIQVVSIGRQYTGVELFDDSGHVVGTLFLKSGKILAANSGSTSGIDAVTSLFRGNRHKRFSVYRTDPLADARSPVGSVGEILLKLMDPDPEPAERISVMEGSLTEFDLLSVLQVISLGRQFTAVEVFDTASHQLGRIEVKAGQVLSATAGHLQGIEAIRRLSRSPRESRFVVYRSRMAAPEHRLGPLAQILLKLADPDDDWDSPEQNTRAKRAAAAAKGDTVQEAEPVAKPPLTTAPSRPPPAPPLPSRPPAPSRPSPPPLPTVAKLEERRPLHPPAADERSPAPASPRGGFLDTHTSPHHVALPPLPNREVPVIVLNGPKGGAGKTTVALNLGVALARQGKRVVLVDGDGNGVLLALNAAARSNVGAHDVIAGKARLEDVCLTTRIQGLRILPSGDLSGVLSVSAQEWRNLFVEARREADVVLVDSAAGLYGPPGEVCAAATHALVVLPAEPASLRALPAYLERLRSLGKTPPHVVGIVLNMLDYRARVSLDVLRELCSGPSAPWVFDIPIARSAAFMEAVARGVPVCRGDRTDTPTIGWVFEMLASGVLERLGILTPVFDEAIL